MAKNATLAADSSPEYFGFEFAKEVATELITLSTALLTLTITFTKEMFNAAPGKGQQLLPTAWAAHVPSIAGPRPSACR